MKIQMIVRGLVGLGLGLGLAATQVRGAVMQYGDRNLLGTGTYASDPTAGATLEGLAPGAVTVATGSYQHTFPFKPAAGAFPGTDQIYTSGGPAQQHDGYSAVVGAASGPQVLTMDYSGLLPAGKTPGTLTLGIAADDFQQPVFHQPFVARINGVVDDAISKQLNATDLSNPTVQFFSVGIDPSLLVPSSVLTLSIDRPGPASDGWAVDFATIGVTPVPEPSTFVVMLVGFLALGARTLRRQYLAA